MEPKPGQKKESFNKTHPEMESDEVFWSNVNDAADDTIFMGERMGDEWGEIKWQTKRRGQVAYDRDGNVLEDTYPVFVKRDELIEAGEEPDNLD